jgi:hypothetical protein
MAKTKGPSSVTVPLSYPVPVDGDAEIPQLTFKRPKTRTIKKLAALIGGEAVKAIMAEVGEGSGEDVSREAIVGLLGDLMTEEKLDGLTDIIADLCDHTAAVIDEIDPLDWPAVFEGIADFFPGLVSGGEPSPPT